VRSFKQLLKLEYPKASAEEHKLMLDLVALMKAFEDAATAEAKAREHQARNATRLSLSIGRPQPQPQPYP
jgi:hypothetical protein